MALLALMMNAHLWAQDRVEQLLQQFDNHADVAVANQFFKELADAAFTDETIAFGTGVPVDSLEQQVWYWAAEWLYDKQQYEQAEPLAVCSSISLN